MAGRTAGITSCTFIEPGVDNPDQRISENTKHATEQAVEFALGIFNAAVTLISFIGILWTVSGALDVTLGTVSFQIPGYMVFAALIYAGIGSTLTYFVGRPIVGGEPAAEHDRGRLPLRAGAAAREQRGGGADPRRARREEGADQLFRRGAEPRRSG